MSRRTVLAGQLRATSERGHPRSVYVCLPDTVTVPQHDAIADAMAQILRSSDRLLYSPPANTIAPIASFAAEHGHPVSSILDEPDAPDLILILIDPYGDNASALRARTLAAHGSSDLVIAELSEPARDTGPHDRTPTRPPAEQTRKST